MDPTLQAALAISGSVVAVLGSVVTKLYLDLRAEREARLGDAREHTKALLDMRTRLSEADASTIQNLEHQVEILLKAEEPSVRPARARRSKP